MSFPLYLVVSDFSPSQMYLTQNWCAQSLVSIWFRLHFYSVQFFMSNRAFISQLCCQWWRLCCQLWQLCCHIWLIVTAFAPIRYDVVQPKLLFVVNHRQPKSKTCNIADCKNRVSCVVFTASPRAVQDLGRISTSTHKWAEHSRLKYKFLIFQTPDLWFSRFSRHLIYAWAWCWFQPQSSALSAACNKTPVLPLFWHLTIYIY